jgi:predicted ATPase with chaperone activity
MDWSSGAIHLLRTGLDDRALTGRGWDRVRRVARTVADLDDRSTIDRDDVGIGFELRG